MTDDLEQGGGEAAPETSSPAPAPPSARESIAAAFDKIGITPEGSERQPGDQDGFTRDQQGRFAPKDPSASPGAPSAPTAHQIAPTAHQPAPGTHQSASAAAQPAPGAPNDAPARFNDEAKAAWAQAHPALKGEFTRAMTEMQKGLGMYQQAVEPLKPYFQIAQQTGVPLHQALDQYISFERSLTSDNPDQKMGAIQELFRIAGVDPRQFAAIVMGQDVPPRDEIVDRFGNVISTIEQRLAAQQAFIDEQQHEKIISRNLSTIDQFAQTHPRIDEPAVAKYINLLLKTDMPGDLSGAYAVATEAIPSNGSPSNGAPNGQPSYGSPSAQTLQTRKGQLSVHGAPPGGSVPPGVRAPATRRGSIATAFEKAGL